MENQFLAMVIAVALFIGMASVYFDKLSVSTRMFVCPRESGFQWPMMSMASFWNGASVRPHFTEAI